MSEEKEKPKENKPSSKTKEILFETAYEKVLFIINKVKDFIKSVSTNENKLIEELDWVIKVITNRSLYTYELVKEKLIKQNEKYNNFINFVKKYNEEVIEMNKKHDIVSSILSITKKEQILLKPSLFLKKLENMDEIKEMKQKKNKNFVYTFGNYILNLYNEKFKKNVNDENSSMNESQNENKKEDVINNDNINDKEKVIKSQTLNNNDKGNEIKKDNNQNTNKIPKKESIDNIENFNIDSPKIKIKNKKPNIKSNSNLKVTNTISQELSEEKYKNFMRLMKAEKNNYNFNHFKINMRNYYLNFDFNGQFMTNNNNYLFKSYFNNIKQNNNLISMNIFKRNKNTVEKSYNLYKSIRHNLSPYNMNNKTKNNFPKNNKISLSPLTNLETNDDKYDFLNNKSPKNFYKTEKVYLQNKSLYHKVRSRNIIKNKIKKGNNNQTNKQNNVIKNQLEINVKKRENSVPLVILIKDNFNELDNLTSIDFNIFELKKKIGYNNVLPLMGFMILKILGLVDPKIINTKKLEPFLKSVNDNYLITTLYHNSLHGIDITQTLFVFFMNSNIEEICETTVLDLLGITISAMGHDLGHPGLNNGYHINASTELGITYNDKSCLENFHSSYFFRILRKEENNILEKFSVQNYKTIRKRIISQILATDMAFHTEIISLIRSKISISKNQERFIFLSGNDKTKFEEQQSLLNYLIHTADLAHNCKKFEISLTWVELLHEEFWDQGDKEKERGLPISFLCDRNNVDVPTSQIGFLKGFILSSFECLIEMFPKLQFVVDNAENNIKRWTELQKEKRLTGWTPEKKKKKEMDDEF